MNKVYLLLFLLYTGHCSAQAKVYTKYIQHEVIYFQGITMQGDRFLGIAKTRVKAQLAIKQFTKSPLARKNPMVYKAIYPTHIIAPSDTDVVKEFKQAALNGYVFLSMEDYNSIEIAQNDTIEAAIWYYGKTKHITPNAAKLHVNELVDKYTKYIKL